MLNMEAQDRLFLPSYVHFTRVGNRTVGFRSLKDERDIEAFLAIGRMMHAESPAYQDIPFDEAYVRELAKHAAASPDEWFACMAEDMNTFEPLAMVIGHKTSMGFNPDVFQAVDYAIYSAPSVRGRPILIKMLLKRFEKWAKDAGCKRVVIGVSSQINDEKAARFFQKLGYANQMPALMKEL